MFKLVTSRIARNNRGFTLIEILIVMIIIAFLASLSAGSFQSSQRKSRDARRKSDLHQIATALEAYYNDKGVYPSSNTDLKIVGCGSICDWGARFYDASVVNGTVYVEKLPSDPSLPRGYQYAYLSTGASYQIYARFENLDDPSVIHIAGVPQAFSDLDCGLVGKCNYGISSPNTTIEAGRTLVDE